MLAGVDRKLSRFANRARLAVVLCGATCFVAPEREAFACTEAKVVRPLSAAVIADSRPVIQWLHTAGAGSYRIQLESRLPGGPVLVSLDSRIVGNSFRPPTSLTSDRAAVKVRVTADCPPDDGTKLREHAATFFIDTTSLCRAPTELTVESRGVVHWSEASGVRRYKVTVLRAEDAAIVSDLETERTSIEWPPDDVAMIVIVRPVCDAGFGARVSALVYPITR